MKKIVLVFAALIGIESSIYADIPLAVSTKTSSSCDMQANGNPAPMTLCFRDEVELIKKYINYNLSHAPAYKRKKWQRIKEKILAKCNAENNDLSDPFYDVGFVGCVCDGYSNFNRKLLNVKE